MENKVERSVWSVAATAIVIFLGIAFVTTFLGNDQSASIAIESKVL